MHIELLSESTLELNYVVLILGSCVIATLGLLSNSAAVIIGAMTYQRSGWSVNKVISGGQLIRIGIMLKPIPRFT